MELDTTTTHPHPHPHPHHRKIELQSALDLAYLQSNMSASIRQKLDLHFPPSASQPPPLPSAATQHDAAATAGPDPMRQRVEDLVAQFLDRVWRAAKANIAVNGQDATTTTTAFWEEPAEPPHTKNGGGTREQEEEEKEREGVDFEYEPYDARLSARVAGLYAEVESLTAHVSRLRRTAPREAAERYAGVLGTVLEEDEKRKEEFGAGDGDGDGAGAGGLLKLDVVRDGWDEDVAAAYDRGVEELRRLGGLAGGGGLGLDEGEGSGSGGGSLTETVGRVQRAKMVALELE